MTTNLDEFRAAQAEQEGITGPTVIFGNEKYELPASLPADVLLSLAEMQDGLDRKDMAVVSRGVKSMLEALLGAQFEQFMANRPSLDELLMMVRGVMDDYGASLGEASGSESS